MSVQNTINICSELVEAELHIRRDFRTAKFLCSEFLLYGEVSLQ